MKCKVVSASLGYNERIYSKGDEIDVDTPSEVKRLVGYGHIEADVTAMLPGEEVAIALDPPKMISKSKGGRKRK